MNKKIKWQNLAMLLVVGGGYLVGNAQMPSVGQDKSVVMIRAVRQEWDYNQPWQQQPMRQGVGSGFVIEGKQILTNAHNVSDCRYVEIKKQHLAKRYIAQVVFIGHDCDLAVLKVADTSFYNDTSPLEIGGLPQVNSTVETYGFPMGGQDVSVTKGVVSRIQMDAYSHSGADSHLVIQTDAAINPGNSGGPVLQDGKVVGVAFQGLKQAENIGYMIPTTVIRHFLTDIADGRYDGYGSLGFAFYAGLHSNSYKAYLKVPPEENGVVVLRTLLGSSVESLLQPGDVIIALDTYAVDIDGNVNIYGLTLHMSEVIEQRQMDEKVSLTLYRQGEKQQINAAVALNRGIVEYARIYDRPPRYAAFAGLVFMPVTRNFLENWGTSWPTAVPQQLRFLVSYADQINTELQRKEYVVLAKILADEINAYSSDFENRVVTTINDQPIWSLNDLYAALSGEGESFIKINFMGYDLPLILERSQATARQGDILKKYQVSAPARLEEKP